MFGKKELEKVIEVFDRKKKWTFSSTKGYLYGDILFAARTELKKIENPQPVVETYTVAQLMSRWGIDSLRDFERLYLKGYIPPARYEHTHFGGRTFCTWFTWTKETIEKFENCKLSSSGIERTANYLQEKIATGVCYEPPE